MKKNIDILTGLSELAKQTAGVGTGHYKLCAMLKIKGYHPFIGFNKMKSHPLQKKFGKSPLSIFLHAEIDVIKNAIRETKDVEGGILYIARVKRTPDHKHWQWGLSSPCRGCLMALDSFGISKVFYTTNQNNVYGVLER